MMTWARTRLGQSHADILHIDESKNRTRPYCYDHDRGE